MAVDTELEKALKSLEERLLQPEVRQTPDLVADLLDDDFVEFGSSGKVYDKDHIIEFLKTDILQPPAKNYITEFKVSEISPEVYLATFCIVRQSGLKNLAMHSLRSSIWRRNGGDWKMLFHQGTLISKKS